MATTDSRTRGQDRSDLVLLVAVCTGTRCAALRRLHHLTEGGVAVESGDSRSEALLRAAVGERPDAVLVSTDCLGPCSQGSVVAVGRGQATVGRLTWLGRPVSLGLVERPERARNLNNWIRGGAPDLITLPTSLLQSSADS